jgi:hypothetical protein
MEHFFTVAGKRKVKPTSSYLSGQTPSPFSAI